MKIITTVSRILVLSFILFIAVQSSSGQKISPSFPSTIERLLNNIEKNILSTAEAMPEDKFYFTPESLNITGSEFKGVRTFAGQIKHLATDNFEIWAPIT